jgi:hypothetical protein
MHIYRPIDNCGSMSHSPLFWSSFAFPVKLRRVDFRRDDCLALVFVTLPFLTADIVIATSQDLFMRVHGNKYHE